MARTAPAVGELAARPTTALAGRIHELAVLEWSWAAAQHGLQIVTITGEPGIGKARLATEFAARLEADGLPVRFGRCEEDLEVAYQLFSEFHRLARVPATLRR